MSEEQPNTHPSSLPLTSPFRPNSLTSPWNLAVVDLDRGWPPLLGVADAARRRWSPWTLCTLRQALHQDVGFPPLLTNFSFLTTTNRDPFLCMLQGTCLGDCLLSVSQDCVIARVQFRDEMRHPLRAVTSSVQSQTHQTTKKVRDSQQLRHLITAKCYATSPLTLPPTSFPQLRPRKA